MSQLAATNGGCGCEGNNNPGCSSIIWLIILLSCCGGCGNSGFFGGNEGCGCGGNSCLWIILLLFCCGGNGNGVNGGFCC